jgi:hypothetical protein
MKEFLEKCEHDDTWYVRKGTPLEKEILNFFHECWNNSHKNIFPGPQPISIERKHFQQLKKNPYLVCEKSDGVRWVFVCLTFEGKKFCGLINRALVIRWVNVNVCGKAKLGTLLDGELVGKNYLVYDAVKVNGQHCGSKNFLDRYKLIERFCGSIMKLAKDPITLVPKKFEPIQDAKHYIEEILPTIEHNSDGLVFTPVNEPIRIGTHETMFKWKPLEKNTIDFQVKWEKRGVWGLYIQDRGMLYFETEVRPEQCDWLRENMIVECRYRNWEYPMWWEPLKQRTDKTYPNNRRTFYRTLVNIQEDIKINEFYNSI